MAETAVVAGSTDRPAIWSPAGIAVLTAVLGPVVGGVLHGINYGRLGLPQRKRMALSTNLSAVMAYYLLTPNVPGILFSFLLAAYFQKSQELLFQKRMADGAAKGSLLWPWLLGAMVALVFLLAQCALRS